MDYKTNQMGTISTSVKLDISPDGVRMTFTSLDSDIAKLIAQAGDFEVVLNEYQTYETNNVVIRSKKVISFVDRPPEPPTEG